MAWGSDGAAEKGRQGDQLRLKKEEKKDNGQPIRPLGWEHRKGGSATKTPLDGAGWRRGFERGGTGSEGPGVLGGEGLVTQGKKDIKK